MAKIGIIFAMHEELNALKKYINIDKQYNKYDLTIFEGTINNNICYFVESSVGKVNAARVTQFMIDKFQLDYIFNLGVAGGVSNKLHIGDIVVADKLYQHDFDITAFNHPKGYIPNLGDYITVNNPLLDICKKINSDALFGPVASGDIFVTSDEMSAKINKKFDALCVEMEAASVAQVSYLCKVPFLIIKSISDIPNNNNEIDYVKFLSSSSEKVANYVIQIINLIK